MSTTVGDQMSGVKVPKLTVRERLATLRAQKMIMAYAVVIPAALFYLTFFLYPVIRAFFLSFTNYRMMSSAREVVGLNNYVRLFSDPKWKLALGHTFQYTAMAVPTVIILAMILALLVNQVTVGRGIYRAIYFAPVMTAGVAIAIIFRYLLHPSLGVGNQVLRLVGLPPYQWYLNPGNAMPTLVLITTFESVGYSMIILLAGLQNIPQHFYDAAKVDGAGAWQRFLFVTIPLLQPTLLFVFVTSVIGAFQVFTAAYLFSAAPRNAMSVALTYVYRWGIHEGYLGYASAAAVVLFGIIMIFTLVQLRLLRVRWEY
ncbi:MAG: sugar ABC transporter permease [Anaerolineales bacterium]|jgi:ABC-type sugar transport system permease subunit